MNLNLHKFHNLLLLKILNASPGFGASHTEQVKLYHYSLKYTPHKTKFVPKRPKVDTRHGVMMYVLLCREFGQDCDIVIRGEIVFRRGVTITLCVFISIQIRYCNGVGIELKIRRDVSYRRYNH